MALYKHKDYLKYSPDASFDVWHNPGVATPHSGIYRCQGCGEEITSNAGNPLPSQDHKQHTPAQGDIRWRLIVSAVRAK
jgi:hypothetical protein